MRKKSRDPKLQDQMLAELRKKITDDAKRYHRHYESLCITIPNLLEREDLHGIIAASHMVYGWMPRIISVVDLSGMPPEEFCRHALNTSSLADAKSFVERVGTTSPINRSWVGLSKLLHMANPTIFPIWDSRVALHFRYTYAGALNRQSAYERYLHWIHQNLEKPEVTAAQEIMKTFGFDVSRVRALELLLFETKPSKQQND